jgi:hypothetical protein
MRRKNSALRAGDATRLSSSVGYTLGEHQHRFSIWAAARSIQRGLANVRIGTIDAALMACGVGEIADTEAKWPTTEALFDRAHRKWCRAIMRNLQSAGVGDMSYGRAAKLTAVYLKCRIVVGGHHEHSFANVIHPPIDRILLQALSKRVRAKDPAFGTFLRTVTWTSLAEANYWDLIARLRSAGLDKPAFWCIERFWDPRREEQ